MKKILLFTCFCLFAVFGSAQRTLNWKISLESGSLVGLNEIKVTVNNTDTCSFIESFFLRPEVYSKTVESYGNVYKVGPVAIFDVLNMFTENGWNVDNIFYREVVSGKCDIDISLISVDGSPEGFFDPINKKRTYILGTGCDDGTLVIYPPFISKAHIRYMKLLKEYYNGKIYYFDLSSLKNIYCLYLCGWRIDALGSSDGQEGFYLFFSHEYEPEE